MNYKHGYARKAKKSIEFLLWQAMIARCYRKTHKSYKNYGGRGIRVCARWIRDFGAFIVDVGPRPSRRYMLDRRDNDGDYKPGNIRWVKRVVSNRNRRNNVLVKIGRRKRTLSAWAEHFNVPYGTVRNRIYRGWPVRRALEMPARTKRKPISEALKKKIRGLFAKGWTRRELADHFGLHGGPDNIGRILYRRSR